MSADLLAMVAEIGEDFEGAPREDLLRRIMDAEDQCSSIHAEVLAQTAEIDVQLLFSALAKQDVRHKELLEKALASQEREEQCTGRTRPPSLAVVVERCPGEGEVPPVPCEQGPPASQRRPCDEDVAVPHLAPLAFGQIAPHPGCRLGVVPGEPDDRDASQQPPHLGPVRPGVGPAPQLVEGHHGQAKPAGADEPLDLRGGSRAGRVVDEHVGIR
jgi:hypothetical protein